MRLRSDTIKIIAMVIMLLDHLAAGILERYLQVVTDYNLYKTLSDISEVVRSIGRIAFPLFCYQLVVGFSYTKSRIKYIRNLFIFAIISTIPFSLLEYGVIYYKDKNSTMVTLLFGALMLWSLEYFFSSDCYKRTRNSSKGRVSSVIIQAAIISVFCLASRIMHSDYNVKGIILIALIYYFRNNYYMLISVCPVLFLTATVILGLVDGIKTNQIMEVLAFQSPVFLSFFIMTMDTGERRYGKWFKWFGYCFYPAHMFLIFLIAAGLRLYI